MKTLKCEVYRLSERYIEWFNHIEENFEFFACNFSEIDDLKPNRIVSMDIGSITHKTLFRLDERYCITSKSHAA